MTERSLDERTADAGPVSRDARWPERLRSWATALPEWLLWLLCGTSLAVALTIVAGSFQPYLTLPLAAVFTAAIAWCRPRPMAQHGLAWVIGSILSLASAGAWALINLRFVSERVQLSRDPDIYTLTALWLMDNPSPAIDVASGGTGTAALVAGTLFPQSNHLVPGMAAVAGWLRGFDAVLAANVLIGAAALVAVYVAGRRFLGPWWALLPLHALAWSLPMLEFSRALYTEPLALALTFSGVSVLWSAWTTGSRRGFVLAGVFLGAVALTRVDGVLPLLGLTVGASVAAVIRPDWRGSTHRWSGVLLLVGGLPLAAVGMLDLFVYSGTYIFDLASQIRLLVAALGLASVLTFAVALVPWKASWLARLTSTSRPVAVFAAGCLGVGLIVLASRPFWRVSRGPIENSLTASLQRGAGVPVDGNQQYAELTLNWLAWNYGWPAVIVGCLGVLLMLVRGAQRTALLWLVALLLPSTALYLVEPSITPDQVWAMRRFLPVVIPGLLLTGTWFLRQIARRGQGQRLLASITAAAFLVIPVSTLPPLFGQPERQGALAGNRAICELLDGRPTIVVATGSFLMTARALCGVEAITIDDPTPRNLKAAAGALGGGDVMIATVAPHLITGEESIPARTVQYDVISWERALFSVPNGTINEPSSMTVGRLQPDGSVEWIPPPGR